METWKFGIELAVGSTEYYLFRATLVLLLISFVLIEVSIIRKLAKFPSRKIRKQLTELNNQLKAYNELKSKDYYTTLNGETTPFLVKQKAFEMAVVACAEAHTHAFVALIWQGNYTSAHHYIRMMSDLCLRTYGACLYDGDRKEKYYEKFLTGGKVEKTHYKGKELSAVWKDLIARDFPQFKELHDEGHTSVHFTNFYDEQTSPEKKRNLSEKEKGRMVLKIRLLNAYLYEFLVLGSRTENAAFRTKEDAEWELLEKEVQQALERARKNK